LGLRKWHDFTDILLTAQDRHHSIDTEGEPSVRWRPEAKGIHEPTESAGRLLFRYPEHLEDLCLVVRIVNPHTAGSQF